MQSLFLSETHFAFAAASFVSMIALQLSIPQRWALLPLLSWLTYVAFRDLNSFSPSRNWNYVWGQTHLCWLTHICYVLYVERRGVLTSGASLGGRFRSAYKVWMDFHARSFTDVSTRSSTQQPRTRRYVVFWRLVWVAWLLALQKLTESFILPGYFSPLSTTDFSQERQTYFRRIFYSDMAPITMRDTALRCYFAFLWAWHGYLMLSIAHHALAVLFVGVLHLDEPEEWPPFFGRIQEATSLRRFWSHTWHRITRRSSVGWASLFSRNVCGLRRNTKMDRILVAFLVFLHSGGVHAAVTKAAGYRCGALEDVVWFSLNYFAIMAEDVLLLVSGVAIGWVLKTAGIDDTRCEIIKARLISGTGTIWMCAFFFWSVPKWYYPKIRCGFY